MISKETGVLNCSDYYLYTPSQQAIKAFFYPVCVGCFSYAPGYHLQRASYNSILIMYILKGNCHVETGDSHFVASAGQIVILDCYQPHKYYTDTGWESLWLHFDGPLVMEYYRMIYSYHGNLLTLNSNYIFEKYLSRIHESFRTGSAIREPLISKYITNLLSEILLNIPENPSVQTTGIIEETIAYIGEHLTERLTLEGLSKRVSLSPYYFTRVFKKETGYTPHEYLILSRINSAKFLLKCSALSIKEIAFSTGFTSESSFCYTFKKREQMTPSGYRLSS